MHLPLAVQISDIPPFIVPGEEKSGLNNVIPPVTKQPLGFKAEGKFTGASRPKMVAAAWQSPIDVIFS